MSLLRDTPAAGADRQREAERAFDALILKQLISASGAFAGKQAAGSALFSDLIVDALADSLASAGRPDHGPANPILSILPADPAAASPPESTASAWPAPLGGAAGANPSARPGTSAALGAIASRLDPHALIDGRSAVTSSFGMRADPFGDGHRHHRGVDLGAAAGAEIVAAADGVVRRSGARGGYGQTVEIDHGAGITTLYAHASELLVAEGETVRKGQPIAKVGDTGRATGPHLHFELRVRDRPVDPVRALKAYGQRAD